jgi:predicted aspartyl protease
MGLTHIAVKLRKPGSNETISQVFLVDTGATDSIVSASVLNRIGVAPIGKRTYELASGEVREFEVVMPRCLSWKIQSKLG